MTNFIASLFDFIAGLLVSSYAVGVIVAVIVGYATIKLFISRKQLRRYIESINTAIEPIQELNSPADFCSAFERISEILGANELLGSAWKDFRKTILQPEKPDDRLVIQSPFQASQFFTAEQLLQSQKFNLHYHHALPNYLTGAGILGTFLGLAAGIHLAKNGLSNPEQILTALKHLLKGASLSFVTSIFGLLSSIFFAIVFRNNQHLFEAKCAEFNELLDKNIEFISLEQLNKQALDLSRERTETSKLEHDLSQQRTEALITFFDQTAFSLTESIQQALDTSLDTNLKGPLLTALNDLRSSIDDMKAAQGKMNEDMLKGIVAQFSAAISGSAGDDMKGFSQSIQMVNEQLGGVVNALQQQQSDMHATTEHSSKAISDSFADGSRQLQQFMQEHMERLNKQTESIASLIETSGSAYANSSSAFSASALEMQDILQGTRELLSSFREIATSSKVSLDGMREVSSSIEKTSSSFSTISKQSGDFIEVMKSSIQQMQASQEHMQEMQASIEMSWKQYQERFDGVDDNLSNIFEQLDEGMRKYAGLYKDYLVEMDKQTSEIVGKIAGAVKEFGDSIEVLNDTMSYSGK